jgi:hypothetical protein
MNVFDQATEYFKINPSKYSVVINNRYIANVNNLNLSEINWDDEHIIRFVATYNSIFGNPLILLNLIQL